MRRTDYVDGIHLNVLGVNKYVRKFKNIVNPMFNVVTQDMTSDIYNHHTKQGYGQPTQFYIHKSTKSVQNRNNYYNNRNVGSYTYNQNRGYGQNRNYQNRGKFTVFPFYKMNEFMVARMYFAKSLKLSILVNLNRKKTLPLVDIELTAQVLTGFLS